MLYLCTYDVFETADGCATTHALRHGTFDNNNVYIYALRVTGPLLYLGNSCISAFLLFLHYLTPLLSAYSPYSAGARPGGCLVSPTTHSWCAHQHATRLRNRLHIVLLVLATYG